MPTLCLCDGAIWTLQYGCYFVNLGINALKFCKIEAQHMLRKCLIFSRFEPSYAYKRYAYRKTFMHDVHDMIFYKKTPEKHQAFAISFIV